MTNQTNAQMKTASTSLRILIAVVFLFSELLCGARSHSYLSSPPADWVLEREGQCRVGGPLPTDLDNCPGPCIAETSSKFKKTARTTTWKRGEQQTAVWFKNNHGFGFVRLTLVPRKHRMNFAIHDKSVFHYACYDSDSRPCRNPEFCGTGLYEGETSFTVPPVPDGEYVLGWSWYGSYAGTENGMQELFHFGDYWSCAFIRVQGGSVPAVQGSAAYRPNFVTGTPAGTCMSLANRHGVCAREPCPNAHGNSRPRGMCPHGFKQYGNECFSPVSPEVGVDNESLKEII